MNEIIIISLSSIIVYLFIIIAIRLFGKKELSQLSVIDLVFILLISNSVQNAMVGGNTSLLGGLTAATSLFVINWILKNLIFKSQRVSQVLQGNPLMLIYKGHTIKKHMATAKISHDELEAALREHGVQHIEDVDLAVLEVDGNISVLSNDFKKHTKKKLIQKTIDLEEVQNPNIVS
jgi:uncharacterized membrane protein YcaP (DUF421 family)